MIEIEGGGGSISLSSEAIWGLFVKGRLQSSKCLGLQMDLFGLDGSSALIGVCSKAGSCCLLEGLGLNSCCLRWRHS